MAKTLPPAGGRSNLAETPLLPVLPLTSKQVVVGDGNSDTTAHHRDVLVPGDPARDRPRAGRAGPTAASAGRAGRTAGGGAAGPDRARQPRPGAERVPVSRDRAQRPGAGGRRHPGGSAVPAGGRPGSGPVHHLEAGQGRLVGGSFQHGHPVPVRLRRGLAGAPGARPPAGGRSAGFRAVPGHRDVDLGPAGHLQDPDGSGPLPQRPGDGGDQRRHPQRPGGLDRVRGDPGADRRHLRPGQPDPADHRPDPGFCRRDADPRPLADRPGVAVPAGLHPLAGRSDELRGDPGPARGRLHRVDRHPCDFRRVPGGRGARRLLPPARADPLHHRPFRLVRVRPDLLRQHRPAGRLPGPLRPAPGADRAGDRFPLQARRRHPRRALGRDARAGMPGRSASP